MKDKITGPPNYKETLVPVDPLPDSIYQVDVP
jgi:hypothetical protein